MVFVTNECAIGLPDDICIPSDVLLALIEKVKNDKPILNKELVYELCAKHSQQIEVYEHGLYDEDTINILNPEVVRSVKPIDPISKKNLFEQLAKSTGIACQKCLLDLALTNNIIDKEIHHKIDFYNFKPIGPKPKEWLSNFDIDKVMQQYRIAYSNFYPYRFNMSDMATKPLYGECALLTTSPVKLYESSLKSPNHLTRFGVVINTAKSTASGQHWVCIYIDMSTDEWTIEFFNSFPQSYKPINDVMMTLLKELEEYSAKLSNTITCKIVMIDSVQHQLSSYQCGVYTLYYIDKRNSGVSYEYFTNPSQPIRDNVIAEFRARIFH